MTKYSYPYMNMAAIQQLNKNEVQNYFHFILNTFAPTMDQLKEALGYKTSGPLVRRFHSMGIEIPIENEAYMQKNSKMKTEFFSWRNDSIKEVASNFNNVNNEDEDDNLVPLTFEDVNLMSKESQKEYMEGLHKKFPNMDYFAILYMFKNFKTYTELKIYLESIGIDIRSWYMNNYNIIDTKKKNELRIADNTRFYYWLKDFSVDIAEDVEMPIDIDVKSMSKSAEETQEEISSSDNADSMDIKEVSFDEPESISEAKTEEKSSEETQKDEKSSEEISSSDKTVITNAKPEPFMVPVSSNDIVDRIISRIDDLEKILNQKNNVVEESNSSSATVIPIGEYTFVTSIDNIENVIKGAGFKGMVKITVSQES